MKISEILNEVLSRPTNQDVQQWWVRNVIQVPHVKKMSKDITHQDVYNEIGKNWDEYKNLDDSQTVIALAYNTVIRDYEDKIRAQNQKEIELKPTFTPAEPEYRKDVAGRTLKNPRYYRDQKKFDISDRAAAAKTRAGRAYRAGKQLPAKIMSPFKAIQRLRDISKKLN